MSTVSSLPHPPPRPWYEPRFFGAIILVTWSVGCAEVAPHTTHAETVDAGAQSLPSVTSAPRQSDSDCASCEASTWTSAAGSSATSDESAAELQTDASTTPLGTSTPPASTDLPEPPDAWMLSDPLFTNDSISAIRLTLDETAWAGLSVDARTYVRGGLFVELTDGTQVTLQDVGVRLKGRFGSARTLDQKAAFLIKVNEFVKGQKLLGLSKVALNNMVQDPSMVHEQLAYLLFREMGVAAPRTGYATLDVNGEPFGLYATVEVVDNETFLGHWYGSADNNLYEGAYGSDFEEDRVDTYDQDRGQDLTLDDLRTTTSALNSMGATDTFLASGAAYFDTAWYARFAATELMMSHWDGYAVTRNNYFLYPDAQRRWTFLPWGTDQTFEDADYDIWRGDARLQRLCTNSRDCRLAMAGAYEHLLQLWQDLDLLGRVDSLESLITTAVAADPRKEYSTEEVIAAIERTREFLRRRPGAVQEQLLCADPDAVDDDGDGASGCGADCNDAEPTVYPGAAELCNWSDDDCDGEVDEDSNCPECLETVATKGGTYAACVQPRPFSAAEDDCAARGGHVASVGSEEEQVELLALAELVHSTTSLWIGFTDRVEEGQFRWNDGSEVIFTSWGSGEPNDVGGEDCTELVGSGQWNDLSCETLRPYVCWIPAAG